ncbi:DUF3568 family protein [Nitrogeniibacter mangrovi]|uniref:DUF3568 family protein n=1 Tax=Nitrogeniibacter mangrovi TaxID=2016596 RepID=A0A6C1B023_9RHOO|nr:DUF3568 family protein [Nitrogeniibacter mangrovi]QID16952.1 DUF3568 family protein [Nitrogeniibacter mangrovi]
MSRRFGFKYGSLVAMTLLLTGCDPISLTALSMGAGVGVSHTLSGIIYKTFTAPLRKVERGSVIAMHNMAIHVVARKTNSEGERVITASAKDRDIEVLLEPLTPRTTRMRVIANNGVLKDRATAAEIVKQTERILSKA